MAITLWPDRRLRRRARRAALCILLGLLLLRTVRDHHDAILRESPVDFAILHERSKRSLPQPEHAFRTSNGSHIDDRYQYQRALQAGLQGSVFLYNDIPQHQLVIVKTVSAQSRNNLPPQLLPTFGKFTSTWPSEIDATLSVPSASHETISPYVPVHDYFFLQRNDLDSPDWVWTLVTPFISGGTLHDLAQELRSIGRTEDLDSEYRSTFYALLRDLHNLHDLDFCHDDVKIRNVFIERPKRWLLGDLGNTREIGHPWHATNLWSRNNRWHDCVLEDMRRALKSYLTFLREASHDREAFDQDFLDCSTDWAKMYWTFAQAPVAWMSAFTRGDSWRAGEWDERSFSPRLGWYNLCIDSSTRAVAVQQELACTRIWWKLWLTF